MAHTLVPETVSAKTQATPEGNKEPQFVEPKEDVRMVAQQENVENKPVNEPVSKTVSETVVESVSNSATETTTPVRRQRKVRA